MITCDIRQGHVLERLREMQGSSLDMCVTSPPYWGLRAYGTDPQLWSDGWCGELGAEPTYQLYVDHMVAVFEEVWRVLKPEGTLWLNLGDCYATGAGKVGNCPGGGEQGARWAGPSTQANRMPQSGLKPKDLVGIPWRVAFALQDAGWYLRSDIIWSKPNPMPESVTDRCTKSHEYIFLLAKCEAYYCNMEAIKEPATDTGRFNGRNGRKEEPEARPPNSNPRTLKRLDYSLVGRNKRSVWTVSTQAFPEAHFAVFPEDLIKPCILAGCPTGGTVLEPFCGSGTTLLVARNLGCNSIGIELNPEYVKIAERRLSQDVMDFRSPVATIEENQ